MQEFWRVSIEVNSKVAYSPVFLGLWQLRVCGGFECGREPGVRLRAKIKLVFREYFNYTK